MLLGLKAALVGDACANLAMMVLTAAAARRDMLGLLMGHVKVHVYVVCCTHYFNHKNLMLDIFMMHFV